MNKDSCQIGPKVDSDGTGAARADEFDAFVIVHGTDTMAYSASALSLMLSGFPKSNHLPDRITTAAEPGQIRCEAELD